MQRTDDLEMELILATVVGETPVTNHKASLAGRSAVSPPWRKDLGLLPNQPNQPNQPNRCARFTVADQVTITLSMKRGLAVNLDIWVEPEPVQGPAD